MGSSLVHKTIVENFMQQGNEKKELKRGFKQLMLTGSYSLGSSGGRRQKRKNLLFYFFNFLFLFYFPFKKKEKMA